jgi:succinate dehydrogenase/fumarate reductase flavoprotein subunit
MQIDRLDTDVLIVGGGIAGLMAAIRASELRAEVLVVEQGNPMYSGAGRAGQRV